MSNEIRYFSMFTGVGGFELGIESVGCGEQESIRKRAEWSDIQRQRNISNDSIRGRESESEERHRLQLWKCVGCSKSDERQYSFNSLSQPKNERPEERREWSSDEQGTLLHDRSNTSFSCVGFSEIDKYANELLKQRFPNIKNYGDATTIDPSELPDFDMLCGGFPCQAFSIAGKRRGFQDTRGTLFFDIARILEVKRPKIVLLENVKGLLNHEKGKTFKVIIQTLSELGYDVQWMVLNSKFFGVPQNRERVFIIGNLGGEPRPEILPFRQSDEEDNRRNTQEPSTSTITSRYFKGGAGTHFLHNIYGGFGEGARITDISPTIRTAKRGGHLPMILNEWHIRKLTPMECERLQGFPDGWTEGFSDTQRYKMMGNAVTVNVIKAIGEKLY